VNPIQRLLGLKEKLEMGFFSSSQFAHSVMPNSDKDEKSLIIKEKIP
jgi:hypothetical protein